MSEWKKVKFLDVVALNPHVRLEKGQEYAFVEMSNASETSRNPKEDITAIYKGGGAKFECGDTVIARIEPCLQNGKAFFCKYKVGFGSTEFLVFRPLREALMDKTYLYYYMRQDRIREAMAKTMVGASGRQRVNNSVFNSFEIPLPPLPIQHRIATILSRYDSLIENYQKQIKLLEEAAQRLYKEWFINLHFPGHENTNIIDGVPEGWEKKKISDVCTMIGAGSTPSRRNNAYWDNGSIRWVKTKELLDNWIFDTEEYITEEGLNNSSTKIFPVNTILMAIYASPTLGRLGILAQECCCNQAALGLVANENFISWGWLYLKLYELRDEFNAVARGAGQQNISGVVVKNWEIIVPDKTTIKVFMRMAKPYFEAAKSLQSQLRLLTEARDRLLPKLMSGEITI